MRKQSGFSHEGVDTCVAGIREQKFQQVFASQSGGAYDQRGS